MVSNSTFSQNTAISSNVYIAGGLHVVFTNVTFTENEGPSGAGLFLGTTILADINNCTFTNNNATDMGFGGGFFVTNVGQININDCVFDGNYAYYGGGIGLAFSNASVTNSKFVNNNASAVGGGIYIESSFSAGGSVVTDYSSVVVQNCSIEMNQAQVGGGIYIPAAAFVQFLNSIQDLIRTITNLIYVRYRIV